MPHSSTRPSAGMRAALAAASAAALAAALAMPAGCGPSGPLPVNVDRDALGTFVTVTAYGRDEDAVRNRVDSAFAAIEAVEGVLDAYDDSSTVAGLNRRWAEDPSLEQTLPPEAAAVLDTTDALGVGDRFSPALWGLLRMYDFEGARSVPPTAAALAAASWRLVRSEAGTARLLRDSAPALALTNAGGLPGPGLDLGGAAKGLALDRAAGVLRASGTVDAALVTAGSTTVTFGEKPDGGPWRVGIEDPREPGRVVAVVEASAAVTVSTSGDYQQHFEREGVNWHHILDPATGRPARGLRSLTVIGAPDGLSSDILSTALFVMGPLKAAEYARDRRLGLYMVDEHGAVTTVGPPANAGWRLVDQAEPLR